MKAITLCATLASILVTTANAADVTWQTPVNISGASDVSTSGTFVGSWAPGNDWGPGNYADLFPVNGVTFNAYGTPGLNFGLSGDSIDRYNGFANPNTGDANYNTLLQTAQFSWSGNPWTLSWDNMTVGNTYLVELWVNDGRNGSSGSLTFTGGANISDPVARGNGVPGQFIIGTFVADAASQNLIISPALNFNLVQVRDLTPVPEPSAFALLAAGAVLLGLRRKKTGDGKMRIARMNANYSEFNS
jgi:hypothetical protein